MTIREIVIDAICMLSGPLPETFSIKHYEYVSIMVIYSACKFKLAK